MSNTYGIYRSDRGYFLTGRNAVYAGGGTDPAVVIPTQDGSEISFPPKFRDDEATANNLFDVSDWNTLYYPTVSGVCEATNLWFTATNLNAWFITRGATRGQVGYDDLAEVANGMIYSDGHRAIALLKPKGDTFRVSARQDDAVRCAMTFMGNDHSELAWENVATDTSSRASFSDVVFTSGVTGVTEFDLTIVNRCGPNPIFADAHTPVTTPAEINAGKMMVSLTLTVDAAGTFPTNNGQIVFTIKPPGAISPVTFTLAKCRVNNPDDLRKGGTRASQTFNITCKSVDGVACPIAIS